MTAPETKAAKPSHPDVLPARPTFRGVYGVPATPDNIHGASIYLFEAMFLAASAQQTWRGSDWGAAYSTSPVTAEAAAARQNPRSIREATAAIAHLFLDGPVNGFPLPTAKLQGGIEKGTMVEPTFKGRQLANIADDFINKGDTRSIRRAFARITRLLSDQVDIDLSPLNQYFLGYTPGELESMVARYDLSLPPDVVRFVNTMGNIRVMNSNRA